MNFYQLATRNVLHNLRSYLAFYLSSSFAVMIFYMFAMFVFHPAIEESFIHRQAQERMLAAEWIIYLFSLFFVLYSVHAFMHTRKKELGILLIMGISPKQLKLLLTTENMVIGASSIVTGIVGGTIFAKMFFAAGAYMLEMQAPLRLYLSWEALGLTAGVFLLLFFVISRFLLFFTQWERTVVLLQGSVKSRREPKPLIALSLLAIALVSIGYGLALLTPEYNLLILLSIIFGTYLLYSQLSVWLIQLVKKNKNMYLRGVHLLTTSDLMYRVKDNARLLFIVTVIATVAFITTGLLSVLNSEKNVENSTFEIEYISFPSNEKEAEHLALIESTLQEAGFDYRLSKMGIISAAYSDPRGFNQVVMIISERELSKQLPSINHPSLNDNEGVIYLEYWTARWSESIPEVTEVLPILDSSSTVMVKKVKKDALFSTNLLVVNDQTFHQLRAELGQSTMYGFNYENWKDSLDENEWLHLELDFNYFGNDYWCYSKVFENFLLSQLPSLTLFIGLFVVIVIFFAAGSFLYFRLFTDLQDESEKYKVLFKIGLTEREMRKSTSFQLAILFFLPFFIAVVHTVCIMVVLWRGDLMNAIGPTVGTIFGFMVLQLIGFTIVRKMYFKKMTELIGE